MNVEMSLQPLGPDGIRKRMSEIQAKLDAANGYPSSFNDALQGAGPINVTPFNPLRGSIGTNPFKSMIQSAANQYGLDPTLFEALVETESNFDPSARSKAGAMGLTQLMPSTAQMLGVKNPFDPAQNLQGGAKYLSNLIQQFGGNVEWALAAYNAGPGAVTKYNGIPPYAETQNYVKKIMDLAMTRSPR